MTLKDIEEKLRSNNLMRIHRSFIVNLSHIDEIATSHVVIAKKAIPLSADLKKQLLQHIQKV
jgi:DNA-binding LytR/AlgR family response regulator